MCEFHVDDVGVELVLEVVDCDDVAIDVSAATSILFFLQKPGGSVVQKTGSLDTTGVDGKIVYETEADDLDEAGVWHVQGKVTIGGKPFGTEIVSFTVASNIYP